MREPQLPPGMKLGPEIVRITGLYTESGGPVGLSVDALAPRDVVIATLKLALLQVEKLSQDVRGTVHVISVEPRGDNIDKRGLN